MGGAPCSGPPTTAATLLSGLACWSHLQLFCFWLGSAILPPQRVPDLTHAALSCSAPIWLLATTAVTAHTSSYTHPKCAQSQAAPASQSDEGPGQTRLPWPGDSPYLHLSPYLPQLRGDPVVLGAPPQTGTWLGDTTSPRQDHAGQQGHKAVAMQTARGPPLHLQGQCVNLYQEATGSLPLTLGHTHAQDPEPHSCSESSG